MNNRFLKVRLLDTSNKYHISTQMFAFIVLSDVLFWNFILGVHHWTKSKDFLGA